MALDMAKLQSLLSVSQVAEKFDVHARIVRKESKAGRVPGAYEILGKYGFDPIEVESWEPPEVGTRTVARREDGRRFYRVALTDEELVTLRATLPADAVKDPRVTRAARKAAKAANEGGDEKAEEASTPEGESPFGDFGLE